MSEIKVQINKLLIKFDSILQKMNNYNKKFKNNSNNDEKNDEIISNNNLAHSYKDFIVDVLDKYKIKNCDNKNYYNNFTHYIRGDMKLSDIKIHISNYDDKNLLNFLSDLIIEL